MRGWEAHPDVREGLGDPPEVPEGVWRATRRSEMGREVQSEVWEAQPEVQKGSGGPSGSPGGVRKPTQSSERGLEAHLEVWEG